MGTILLVLQMRKLWLRGMSDTPNISQQSSALMLLLMTLPRCPLLRGLAKAWHGGHWRRLAESREEAGITAILLRWHSLSVARESDRKPESGPCCQCVCLRPDVSIASPVPKLFCAAQDEFWFCCHLLRASLDKAHWDSCYRKCREKVWKVSKYGRCFPYPGGAAILLR